MPRNPRIPVNQFELARLYEREQKRLIREIQEITARIETAQLNLDLVDVVHERLTQLNKDTHKWTAVNIPKAVDQGINNADADIRKQYKSAGEPAPDLPVSFVAANPEALTAIVKSVNAEYTKFINFAGNRLITEFDSIIANKIATGQTIRQAQAEIVQYMQSDGITAFVDSLGRKHQLSKYAEMVARSSTANVTNQASIDRSLQIGGDLVKMTRHNAPCPICAPLQGRVYSISGNNPNYPALEIALPGGFTIPHPNCKHRFNPWVESLKTPKQIEAAREFSGRPFNVEDLPQAQQKAFEAQERAYQVGQKAKAQMNADQKQYQRFIIRLGDKTPKSFAGFRRMKQSNSDNWQKLQTDYRAAGVELKQEIVEV